MQSFSNMTRLSILLLFIFTRLSAQEINSNQEQLAVEGYDIVSYFKTNTASKGSKAFEVNYKGVYYWFISSENKQLFLNHPATYLPKYGGWCAYAMARGEQVMINPEAFLIREGELYLFYKTVWVNTLPKWIKNSTSLKKNADNYWKQLVTSKE